MILNCRTRPVKKTYKKKAFVVVNDDKYGYHSKAIINALLCTGLEERESRFGGKRASSFKYKDVLVVGDSTSSVFTYDYRVVSKNNLEELANLDARSFKIYNSLNKEFYNILSRLEEYAEANYGISTVYDIEEHVCNCGCCKPKSKSKPKKKSCSNGTHVNVNLFLDDEPKPTFLKRDVTRFKRVEPVCSEEKYTIFGDWVKIGMHQFDIQLDVVGNEFIEDSTHNRYYITEDRWGTRHLVVTQ